MKLNPHDLLFLKKLQQDTNQATKMGALIGENRIYLETSTFLETFTGWKASPCSNYIEAEISHDDVDYYTTFTVSKLIELYQR